MRWDVRDVLSGCHISRNPWSRCALSSTTAAISPAHAWYVQMGGARMFYSGKDQSFLLGARRWQRGAGRYRTAGVLWPGEAVGCDGLAIVRVTASGLKKTEGV